MKIVFFGSSSFSVPSLEALSKTRHEISCVITQPDKPKGRGLHFEGTAINEAAKNHGLKVHQPQQINTLEAINFFKSHEADLFVVVAYGQILSQGLLDIPKISSVNLHASLLPKYRGAAPINWALINGEKVTGVSLIKMVRKMDAGGIIAQKETGIEPQDTAITLGEKLAFLAADLLLGSLDSIEKNNYQLKAQDEKAVTFAPKLQKQDGLIDWGKPSRQILDLIRGCIDWPGAFTYYRGKLLKIFQATAIEHSFNAAEASTGTILRASKEGIVVRTKEGDLIIKELQLESKKRMGVEEFIAGHKIFAGEIFAKK